MPPAAPAPVAPAPVVPAPAPVPLLAAAAAPPQVDPRDRELIRPLTEAVGGNRESSNSHGVSRNTRWSVDRELRVLTLRFVSVLA